MSREPMPTLAEQAAGAIKDGGVGSFEEWRRAESWIPDTDEARAAWAQASRGPEPAKPARPKRGRPGQRVAREPSGHPVPANADHTSGLVAALDSGFGRYLKGNAFLLWLYLLRIASPSERHRRVEGLRLGDLGELAGLTKDEARNALARLKWTGMVVVDKPGRFGGGWAKGLTAVYAVPWPTTQRLDGWRSKLSEPTSWGKRIPKGH